MFDCSKIIANFVKNKIECRQFLKERPVAQHPLPALVLDEARLHALASGQLEQLCAGEQRLEAGNRLAHQQRFLVPMAAHELGRAQASEQGQRLLYIHGIDAAARALRL